MEAKAYLRNARISPRKVQIVLDLIRNKPVDVALATLDTLYVAECYVTPGPIMKRIQPRAQGRAFRIYKRTSHITVVLKEEE